MLVVYSSVNAAECIRSPPFAREGPGSIPGAGKLDSGSILRWSVQYNNNVFPILRVHITTTYNIVHIQPSTYNKKVH